MNHSKLTNEDISELCDFGLVNRDPYKEVGSAIREEIERESEALQLLRARGYRIISPQLR